MGRLMPNWVYNSVSLHAPTEQLRDFYDTLCVQDGDKEPAFSFQAIIPRPTEEDENWYNWNSTNWGTKWDAGDGWVELEEDYLSIRFDTAWSPPIPIFSEIAAACHERGIGLTCAFEEEQGWGGEWELNAEGGWDIEEWDIPNCHADFVKRDKVCYCEIWEEETWFSDCPRKGVAV